MAQLKLLSLMGMTLQRGTCSVVQRGWKVGAKAGLPGVGEAGFPDLRVDESSNW